MRNQFFSHCSVLYYLFQDDRSIKKKSLSSDEIAAKRLKREDKTDDIEICTPTTGTDDNISNGMCHETTDPSEDINNTDNGSSISQSTLPADSESSELIGCASIAESNSEVNCVVNGRDCEPNSSTNGLTPAHGKPNTSTNGLTPAHGKVKWNRLCTVPVFKQPGHTGFLTFCIVPPGLPRPALPVSFEEKSMQPRTQSLRTESPTTTKEDVEQSSPFSAEESLNQNRTPEYGVKEGTENER